MVWLSASLGALGGSRSNARPLQQCGSSGHGNSERRQSGRTQEGVTGARARVWPGVVVVVPVVVDSLGGGVCCSGESLSGDFFVRLRAESGREAGSCVCR
jgi:hypothetical protein